LKARKPTVGIAQWGGIVGACIVFLSSVVSVVWWFAKRALENRIAKVEADFTKEIATTETRVAKAEASAARAEADFDRRLLVELRGRLPSGGETLSRGQILQQEIGAELRYVMQRLGATESSVLVRDPDPGSKYLFFLAAHGPAAPQLRTVLVGPDSIAGTVLRRGNPLIVEDPYRNPDFSAMIDMRTEHVTRAMVTIPLYAGSIIVGVAQFLNRENGSGFDKEDERTLISETASIGLKVSEFVRDADNYVQVGLYAPPSPAHAAILFCDLSSSSSLFRVLHESGAVTCINDYLSQVTDIVLSAGGSIDKYLGDGAMFRFMDKAPSHAESGSVAVQSAAEAALKSTAAFGRINSPGSILAGKCSKSSVGRVLHMDHSVRPLSVLSVIESASFLEQPFIARHKFAKLPPGIGTSFLRTRV